MSGTSMAAPYVTGVAALLLSIDSDLTTNQLKTTILNSVDVLTSLDDLCVTEGRLNAYNAVKYVFENYVASSYTLSNYSSNRNISKTINGASNYFLDLNGLYKLDVTYAKYYEFNISSSNAINVQLYDENWQILNFQDLNDDSSVAHMIKNFSIGTYYLKAAYEDLSLSGTISTQIVSRNTQYLNYSHENDILVNDYNGFDYYYYINNQGAGFYNFTLTAAKADGTEVIYPSNALVIKDHMDEATEYKYNVLGFSDLATSDYGINNMYVYLERNGYFYIHLNMPDTEYSSMTLNITKVDSQEIDVSSRTDQKFTETLFTEDVIQEYAKSFTIDQRALFNLTFSTLDTLNHNVTVLLIKKEYNSVTGAYYKIDMIADYLSNTTKVQKYEVDLEEGTYYIGYFGNTYGAEITASLERVLVINDITTQVLVADPSSSHTYGTEVRFNNGIRGEITIYQGYTRSICIVGNGPTNIRQDYIWQSSNSSIASVNQYGIVTGYKAGTVTITCINEANPSYVGSITIIIL